jgi:hypothetical protein
MTPHHAPTFVKAQRTLLVLAFMALWPARSLTAQSIALTFTAQDAGATIALDSLRVENLTQIGDTVLYAPDTVLTLISTTGIDGDATLEAEGLRLIRCLGYGGTFQQDDERATERNGSLAFTTAPQLSRPYIASEIGRFTAAGKDRMELSVRYVAHLHGGPAWTSNATLDGSTAS